MTPLSPRETHALEQFEARIRTNAEIVARYKQVCIDAGMSKREAWEMARSLELRMMDAAFDRVEAERWLANNGSPIEAATLMMEVIRKMGL